MQMMITTISAALLMLMVNTVIAQPQRGNFGNPQQTIEQRLQRMQQRLNLSEQQQQQIREIMQQKQQVHQSIAAQFGVDPQDQTTRRNLDPATRQQMREQMQAVRASHRAAIAGILTDQQREIWQSMRRQGMGNKGRFGKTQ